MIYTAALTPEASLADMQSVMRVQPCGEAGVYLYVEQAYSGTSQKSTKRATGLDRGPAYEQNHTGNRSLAVCCSKITYKYAKCAEFITKQWQLGSCDLLSPTRALVELSAIELIQLAYDHSDEGRL